MRDRELRFIRKPEVLTPSLVVVTIRVASVVELCEGGAVQLQRESGGVARSCCSRSRESSKLAYMIRRYGLQHQNIAEIILDFLLNRGWCCACRGMGSCFAAMTRAIGLVHLQEPATKLECLPALKTSVVILAWLQDTH